MTEPYDAVLLVCEASCQVSHELKFREFKQIWDAHELALHRQSRTPLTDTRDPQGHFWDTQESHRQQAARAPTPDMAKQRGGGFLCS
jgi:hypothetical protein